MTQADDQRVPHTKAFAHHLVQMPHWHKGLLVLATLLLGVGAAGQLVTTLRPPPSQQPVTLEKQDTPGAPGQSHFVTSTGTTPGTADTTAPPPSLRERVSPWLTHVGLSVLVGFIVGWVFRAFLKMMSLIALAIIAVMAALSYFHVLNVDLSAARQEYASTMAWATDQAQHLGRAILNHVPGSTSSVVGFFIGFRRH
jgi:uncharacterized membrane protein (Fun14 family)